jgi:hypothetical protein
MKERFQEMRLREQEDKIIRLKEKEEIFEQRRQKQLKIQRAVHETKLKELDECNETRRKIENNSINISAEQDPQLRKLFEQQNKQTAGAK